VSEENGLSSTKQAIDGLLTANMIAVAAPMLSTYMGDGGETTIVIREQREQREQQQREVDQPPAPKPYTRHSAQSAQVLDDRGHILLFVVPQ